MGAKNGEPTYGTFQPSPLLRKVLSFWPAESGRQGRASCATMRMMKLSHDDVPCSRAGQQTSRADKHCRGDLCVHCTARTLSTYGRLAGFSRRGRRHCRGLMEVNAWRLQQLARLVSTPMIS